VRFGGRREHLEELASEGHCPSSHDDLYIVLECDRPLVGSSRHCSTISTKWFPARRERSFSRKSCRAFANSRLRFPIRACRPCTRSCALRRIVAARGCRSRNGIYLHARRIDPRPLFDGSTFEARPHLLPPAIAIGLQTRFARGPPDLAGPIGVRGRAGDVGPRARRAFRQAFNCRSTITCPSAHLAKQEAAKTRWRLPFTLRPARWPVRRGRLRASRSRSGRTSNGHSSRAHSGFRARSGRHTLLNEIEELSPESGVALVPMLNRPARRRNDRVCPCESNPDLRPRFRAFAESLGSAGRLPMPVRPLRSGAKIWAPWWADPAAPGAAKRNGCDEIRNGQALLLHGWPYNVSELDSCVHTAVGSRPTVLSTGRSAALFFARGPWPGDLIEGDLATALQTVEGPLTRFPSSARNVRARAQCNCRSRGAEERLLHSHCDRGRQGVIGHDGHGSLPLARCLVGYRVHSQLVAARRQAEPCPSSDVHQRIDASKEAADRLAMAFGTYRRTSPPPGRATSVCGS